MAGPTGPFATALSLRGDDDRSESSHWDGRTRIGRTCSLRLRSLDIPTRSAHSSIHFSTVTLMRAVLAFRTRFPWSTRQQNSLSGRFNSLRSGSLSADRFGMNFAI